MTTSAVSNLKMEIRDGNHSSYIETIVNVTSNIILYTRKYHQPFLKILYEIECNLPADCYFELNFHESQNILLIDQNGNEIKDNLILKSKISPYNRVYLGEVRVDDPTYRSVLKSKYNWRKIGLLMKNVNEIALRDKKIRIVSDYFLIVDDISFLQTEIENIKRLILPFNRNRPEATIELFSHHGIRHIDVDFLPDLSFHDGNDISDENKGPRKFDITWRRARFTISPLVSELMNSEIFEKDLCIFPPSMDLSPSTLCKGPLSSLIFLQTVYSLCECPAIIKVLALFLPFIAVELIHFK